MYRDNFLFHCRNAAISGKTVRTGLREFPQHRYYQRAVFKLENKNNAIPS